MSEQFLLGADLGTGALKLTLLSTKGKVSATAVKEYPTYYPQISWSEQNPEDWFGSFKLALDEIMSDTGISANDIVAVAFDGATHTAVLMDEDFRVLRNAILWSDQRSLVQSNYLHQEYGDKIFDITYHYPDTLWTLPQALWVRDNEPAIWQKTKRILFAKDYLRYLLTGEYVTDRIEAMGSMFFDVREENWSDELCDIMQFSIDDLPHIVAPTDVVGKVTAHAGKETGLAPGTPVLAGATDTCMEVLAAGAIEKGQATVKLATAGRICVITEQAYPHPFLMNYRHVIPGKWYPGTTTRSCASSYRWFRDTFADHEQGIADRTGANVYHILDEAAKKISLGSEGLFFHPYLLGEFTPYADPYLKASFVGLSMKHTKAHCARAVLEGVAFSLRDCLDVIRELNVSIDDIRIIGGGAKSPLWRQIVADVLGIQVTKMAIDDSSFGSALMAGVGIGVFSDLREAVTKCTEVQEVIEPNMTNHEKYEELFALYKEIHDGLEKIFPKVNQVLRS